MPNGDYQRATRAEQELSAVLALLEELRTGTRVDAKTFGSGYHHGAYGNANAARINTATKKLVTALTQYNDLSGTSLEMQKWWRDHLTVQADQRDHEAAVEKKRRTCDAAMKKLTPAERQALGLQP